MKSLFASLVGWMDRQWDAGVHIAKSSLGLIVVVPAFAIVFLKPDQLRHAWVTVWFVTWAAPWFLLFTWRGVAWMKREKVKQRRRERRRLRNPR